MANEFDAEGWIERAAIIEYMGGKTREAAERMTTELLGANPCLNIPTLAASE
jgi:hypothetical protein